MLTSFLSYSHFCSSLCQIFLASSLPMISSIMVFSGSYANSCSRKEIRMSFRKIIFPPESELSAPARIFSRELLPHPLGPTRAILSPSFMLKDMLSNSVLGPYDLLMFSTCR